MSLHSCFQVKDAVRSGAKIDILLFLDGIMISGRIVVSGRNYDFWANCCFWTEL